MDRLTIKTRHRRQVVDITGHIEKTLGADPANGICFVHVLHTTAALATADLDPGTDLDMLDAFEAMMPKLNYRHPHNPAHAPDHIFSSMIGSSVSVPVDNGRLLLGTWQRIVLIEFDGPRERQLSVVRVSGA